MINRVFQRHPILANRNPLLDHSKSHVRLSAANPFIEEKACRAQLPPNSAVSHLCISITEDRQLPHRPLPETKTVFTLPFLPKNAQNSKPPQRKVRLVTVKTCLSSNRFASFKPRSLAERRNGDCNFAGAWAGHVAGNPVPLMRCAVAEMSWDKWQKMAVICSYMAVWSRNCVELRWKRFISSSSYLPFGFH